MIKNLPFKAIAALLLISCSDSDKFTEGSKPKLEFDIFYDIYRYRNEPYIYAKANLSVKDDSEYFYYYWIMDGERFYSQYVDKKISYGEHFLEFVLIDCFSDTLSESKVVRINEPLRIFLLSPVESYEAAKIDTIVFQYKISGIDTWEEEPETVVYISADSTDEKRWRPLKGNFLAPPLNGQVYYWKIKAFTEQDTVFSEVRSLCIKN
jgi:hypothetical protein